MEWTSVKDSPPEDRGYYLTWGQKINGKCMIDISFFVSSKDGFFKREYHGEITHWMPLPNPPKEDNNG